MVLKISLFANKFYNPFFLSFVAFLLNHASPDHFQPYSIRDAHVLLAEQFRSAKFSINGGISLFKSGIVPTGKGFPLRKGAKSNDNIDPADVSFHLLPTNQNATDNFSVYTAAKPENLGNCYWASEASPTLGCSIEISGDIYMYVGMSVVCQINCVGGITWTKHAHAQSQVLGC